MLLIDISVTTTAATPEWPGDTPFSCGWAWDMAAGASVNVSTITMSPHVGTHADAPVHVTIGAEGVDQLPLDAFHGAVTVVDISGIVGEIEFDTLEPMLEDGVPARLLVKTGCTIADGKFPDRWPALSQECVRVLTDGGLLLLGVDAPSVDDRESKTLDIHHALFDGGAQVLENLDLRAAAAGEYELCAFPAKFGGMDAAPVRAVLMRR